MGLLHGESCIPDNGLYSYTVRRMARPHWRLLSPLTVAVNCRHSPVWTGLYAVRSAITVSHSNS